MPCCKLVKTTQELRKSLLERTINAHSVLTDLTLIEFQTIILN